MARDADDERADEDGDDDALDEVEEELGDDCKYAGSEFRQPWLIKVNKRKIISS